MLAGVLSYFRADKNTQRIRQLHRLLQLIKRARTVQSIEELEGLQDEADIILGTAIQQAERGQLDESGIAIFALAIDQARAALSEQRTVLLLKPENVPGQRMLPPLQLAPTHRRWPRTRNSAYPSYAKRRRSSIPDAILARAEEQSDEPATSVIGTKRTSRDVCCKSVIR